MACTVCDKRREAQQKTRQAAPKYPRPFRTADIQVVDQGEVRPYQDSDWGKDKTKLLVLIPQAYTPFVNLS